MNTEFEQACRLLEAKPFRSDGPFERYTAELWQFVDQKMPGFGPAWYRQLTERFRIGGASFWYPIDADRDYMGHCTILRPSTFLRDVYAGWPLPEAGWPVSVLFQQGFFCFAEGDDGGFWMFHNDALDDPPVYFLELSGWNGKTASSTNGLISPAITLSQLFQHGATYTEANDE